MNKITNNQEKVLEIYKQFAEKNLIAPTQREIAEITNIGLKSVSSAIKSLIEKGILENERGKSRSVRLVNTNDNILDIPLIGSIAAGTPIFSEQHFDGNISISTALLDSKYKYFALRVKGESMIEAGILDGDIAILKQVESARVHEVVACCVGEDYEITLKEYGGIKNGITTLIPRNPNMGRISNRIVSVFGSLAMIIREY